MDQIPKEIFDWIIQYIPEVKYLGRLTQVNRKFSNILNSHQCWKDLCQSHLFADVITKRKNRNCLSWKKNYKIVKNSLIKSCKFDSCRVGKSIVELKENGKCYLNELFTYETKYDYRVIEKHAKYHMYDITLLGSIAISIPNIVDFITYGSNIILVNHDKKIFSFNIRSNNFDLIDIPVNSDDEIKLKFINIGIFVIVKSKKQNELYYLDNFYGDYSVQLLQVSNRYNIIDIVDNGNNCTRLVIMIGDKKSHVTITEAEVNANW